MAAVWKERPDLMKRLVSAQSVLDFIDIMSFVAFFDTQDELERHIVANEEYAAKVAAKNLEKSTARPARAQRSARRVA